MHNFLRAVCVIVSITLYSGLRVSKRPKEATGQQHKLIYLKGQLSLASHTLMLGILNYAAPIYIIRRSADTIREHRIINIRMHTSPVTPHNFYA